MSSIGNIIWLILGGLLTAILYWLGGLLRGVLSEDGLYNMLEDVKRIKERAEKVVGEGK